LEQDLAQRRATDVPLGIQSFLQNFLPSGVAGLAIQQ
jgi:hypothetical protein